MAAPTSNVKITGPWLDVDFYPQFLTPTIAELLYTKLEKILPHAKGRKAVLIGSAGLVYKFNIRGQTSERAVIPWDLACGCGSDICLCSILPILLTVKKYVDNIAGATTTVLVIQRYHDGTSGIAPHRDKEMVLGTKICGVSLGATRKLVFERTGCDPLSLTLNSGSLYIMNPPTNSYWSHSVVKEPHIKQSRISLTFRNYAEPS